MSASQLHKVTGQKAVRELTVQALQKKLHPHNSQSLPGDNRQRSTPQGGSCALVTSPDPAAALLNSWLLSLQHNTQVHLPQKPSVLKHHLSAPGCLQSFKSSFSKQQQKSREQKDSGRCHSHRTRFLGLIKCLKENF